MSLRTPLVSILAATSLVFVASASLAMPAPGSALRYTVTRNGDEVGSHIIQFSKDKDALKVDIHTDVKVYLAFIPVYHFKHDGRETWQHGHLVSLVSKTDDDGTPKNLDVELRGDKLAIDSSLGKDTAEPDIQPASLWNAHIVSADHTVLLNTLDGKKMSVNAAYVGTERINAKNGPVAARHYAMTGELERELWFSADDVLMKVRFKGSDGSTIEYLLN